MHAIRLVTAAVFGVALGSADRVEASGGFDPDTVLQTPGVRLVALEFYATWCAPCMAAVPKWKTLHEKYRRLGLRLIVVATQDPKGGCVNPGWAPDDIICDDDGRLAERFGAESLPAAFLWSWEGRLLVKKGHVEDVEAAIQTWMRETPRIDVVAGDLAAGVGISKPALLTMVRDEVQRDDKLLVIATEAERKQLDAVKKRSLEVRYDNALQCEIGIDLSANSLLTASIVASGSKPRLHLALLSAERGCLVASAVEEWQHDKAKVVIAATVRELMQKLKRSAELPFGANASRATAVRPEERTLGESGPEWKPESGGEQVLVSFSSKPTGAMVMLDGNLLCQDSSQGCSRAIPAGQHSVTMQKERYQRRTERVNLDKGSKIDWKLEPDFAVLDVESEPPGLEVTLDDDALGKTPIIGRELPPGGHRVRVNDACFYESGMEVQLERGETKRVKLTPKPREGAVQVAVEDTKGNAIEAEVRIDGKRAGFALEVIRASVCAKKLEVVSQKHGVWAKDLAVEERQTQKVKAVLDASKSIASLVVGERGRVCVLWASGQIDCWGDVVFGESLSPAARFETVAIGGRHVCGLNADDRSVVCWGDADMESVSAPTGAARAVAAGWIWTCAIRDRPGDANVACWGKESNGRVVLSDQDGSFQQLIGATFSACAITETGALRCWGRMRIDERGPFVSAAIGPDGRDVCGLDDKGRLSCWAQPEFDPGNGVKALAPDGTFKSLAIGNRVGMAPPMCGIRLDDTIVCSGGIGEWPSLPGRFSSLAFVGSGGGASRFCAIGLDHHLVCVQPGGEKIETPLEGEFTRLAGHDGLLCAIREEGSVACWTDAPSPCNPLAFGRARTGVPRSPLDEKGKYATFVAAIQHALDDWIACAKEDVTPDAEELQFLAGAIRRAQKGVKASDPKIQRLRATLKRLGGRPM